MTDLALVDYLLAQEAQSVARHLVRMSIGDDQVGLRYENDVLVEILPPGAHACHWQGLLTHRLERIDLNSEVAQPPPLVGRLAQPALYERPIAGLNGVLMVSVPAYHVAVLKVDEQIRQLLPPGLAAFWRFNRDVQVELVDTRWQSLEVSGQDILSRDKLALRLKVSATWRYSDVLQAHRLLHKPLEHLYRELQFGLRAAAGTGTTDELLDNKQLIDEVGAHVTGKLAAVGIEVGGVGVKDIILPGKMKAMLGQLFEAQKSAEAHVIRRREETAATRSLLNTAKVMEDNSTALRLKELETFERVAERIDRISVFGGLEQLLSGLVNLGWPAEKSHERVKPA